MLACSTMDNQSSRNNQANSSNSNEFALHKLNDHCLLKIFSFLGLKDAENLAKMSGRLKNLSLYPMHKRIFAFHSDMVTRKTEQNVTELDAVLGEFGEHIKSWSLTIVNEKGNFDGGVEVLRRVIEFCKNLKKLKVVNHCDFRAFDTACEDAARCFENVEYLICKWCDNLNLDFLQRFRKLKHVNFVDSGASAKDLQILFRNNQEIESFHVNGGDGFSGGYHCREAFCSAFSLCEFGPKFNKLCLGAACQMVEMGPMQRLATTNLTKLKLDAMYAVDLDIFLAEMAKTGNLKELDLHFSLESNRTWIDLLQSCQQLELLVLRQSKHRLEYESVLSSVVWPPNLKYLRTNFRLTDVEFLSTIRQLKFLERLRLSQNSKIDVQPIPLKRKLENIFNERITRPRLKFTIGTSGLAIIDFKYNQVLHGFSIPQYNNKSADVRNFIGIDFSVNTYVDWQWNAKTAIHDEPKKKFGRPTV